MDWFDTLQRTFLDFDAMWQVLPQMLMTGLRNTLIISIAATVIGLVLGMVVAIMGISTSKWLRIPARIYTDVFRGLPAILTILLIGQGSPRSASRSSGRRRTRSAYSR
jgi:polar amino acid transport system permease protein